MEQIRACCFWPNEQIIKVNWEITGKCQLKCKHCLNKHRRSSAEISLAKAKNIIDELHCYHVSRIIFTGGEPLLYKDIFKLIRYSQQYNIDVSLNTNGLLLHEHFAEILACLPLKIRIGLCGFSAETHDGFNGKPGAFVRVISNVIEMLPYNPRISLQYTLTKKNMHELPNLYEFLKRHNIKAKLNDIIKVENGQDLTEYIVNQDELDELINSEFMQNKEYIDLIRPRKGALQKCPAGRNVIGILPDGKITPCSWISSFTSDYDSENIRDVFEFSSVIDSLFDHPLCDNCKIPDCGKGCIAVALKSQPSIDPLCPIL